MSKQEPRKRNHLVNIAAAAAVTTALAVAFAGGAEAKPASKRAASKVAYPESYREWTHVKSMWLSDKHGLADPFAGLHHIYANDKARLGLTKGGQFADGSTFAFDLLAASPKDEAMVEGERKLLGVMHKDAKRFASTGGWGFEAFGGSSKTKRLVSDGGVSCYACHLSRKSAGYVFTEWRN